MVNIFNKNEIIYNLGSLQSALDRLPKERNKPNTKNDMSFNVTAEFGKKLSDAESDSETESEKSEEEMEQGTESHPNDKSEKTTATQEKSVKITKNALKKKTYPPYMLEALNDELGEKNDDFPMPKEQV